MRYPTPPKIPRFTVFKAGPTDPNSPRSAKNSSTQQASVKSASASCICAVCLLRLRLLFFEGEVRFFAWLLFLVPVFVLPVLFLPEAVLVPVDFFVFVPVFFAAKSTPSFSYQMPLHLPGNVRGIAYFSLSFFPGSVNQLV